jgi:hydroxylamine reductase
MFCNQCQETAKNTGCTVKGVCGKADVTSDLQDLLIFSCQGLAYATVEARKQGIDTNSASKHIVNCLFTTITNANFDDTAIVEAVKENIRYRDNLKSKVRVAASHPSVSWTAVEINVNSKPMEVGVTDFDANEDIRSLKQYVLYGLKGMAAYAEHAFNLGYEDNDIYNFIEESLIMLTRTVTLDEVLNRCAENRRVRSKSYGIA